MLVGKHEIFSRNRVELDAITRPDGQVIDYAYDTAGRLTDVFVGGAPRWHYEYDANSNRIAFDNFVTNESTSGTYDAQDRLLAYGGATFTYTANGELLTKTDAGLVTRATTTTSSATSTPSPCPTAASSSI